MKYNKSLSSGVIAKKITRNATCIISIQAGQQAFACQGVVSSRKETD